jgi:hypothetical protein
VPLKVDPRFISDAMTTDTELAGKVSKDAPAITKTITAAGTTGDRTINTPAGTVNFAAGMSQITVTNSLCTTNSIVIPVVRTADVNATIFSCVPSNGSFLITLAAPPDIEVSVGFLVIN